jgi:hypothetical protein
MKVTLKKYKKIISHGLKQFVLAAKYTYEKLYLLK